MVSQPLATSCSWGLFPLVVLKTDGGSDESQVGRGGFRSADCPTDAVVLVVVWWCFPDLRLQPSSLPQIPG